MPIAKLLFVFFLTSLVGRGSVGLALAPGSTPINKPSPTSRALPDLKEQPAPQPQSQTGALIPEKAGSDKAKDPGNDNRKANGVTGTLHHVLLIPGVLPFAGSLIAAVLTFIIYFKTRALSRVLADRTVRIEAQKFLLEINKQLLSNPELLAIYDEEFDKLPAARQQDAKLRAALRAMAYMNINVFEIAFAVYPGGTGDSPWKEYFMQTVEKCTFVRQELRDHRGLYNPILIKLFNECPKSKLPDKRYPDVVDHSRTFE